MPIRKVWIEDGCITCDLCQDLAPEIFEVPAGEICRTKKGHEKFLVGDPDLDERIQEAADTCPVEVIAIDGQPSPP